MSSGTKMGPWPTTREIAKVLGAKHYFTAEPCKRGHVAPRFTAKFTCVVCAAEKQRIENMSLDQIKRKKEYWQDWYSRPENREAQIQKAIEAVQTDEGRERNRRNANRYYHENKELVRERERERAEHRWFMRKLEDEEAAS